MSNNAIYEGSPYRVVDIVGHELELKPVEEGRGRSRRVDVMVPSLIIDPTDDQWFAARKRRTPNTARLRRDSGPSATNRA